MWMGLLALLLLTLGIGAIIVSLHAIARRRLVLQRLYGMEEVSAYHQGFRDDVLGRLTRLVSREAIRTFMIPLSSGVTRALPTAAGSRARKRHGIARALPEFAARLYCLMELGFGLESALGIIVLEHPKRASALKAEWFRYLQDIRMGATRQEALIGLRQRVQVPELADLVGALLLGGDEPAELRRRCRECVGRLSRMASPRPPLALYLLIALEIAGIYLLQRG